MNHAKLLRDIKTLTDIKNQIEASIRDGNHSDLFDLIEPPVTMFVPSPLWKNALGDAWVKEHQVPQNKKPIIKAKK